MARTSNFAEAVVLATNLGDDADTVAAITGQLAGSLFGYQAIRNDWLEQLSSQGFMFGMARQLIDRTMAGEVAPKAPAC